MMTTHIPNILSYGKHATKQHWKLKMNVNDGSASENSHSWSCQSFASKVSGDLVEGTSQTYVST